MNKTVVTLPVTLNGETRQVEFKSFSADKAYTEVIAIARCGRTGTKAWPARLFAWKQQDGSWNVDYTFYRLNRNTGRVHSWAEPLTAASVAKGGGVKRSFPRQVVRTDCPKCGAGIYLPRDIVFGSNGQRKCRKCYAMYEFRIGDVKRSLYGTIEEFACDLTEIEYWRWNRRK